MWSGLIGGMLLTAGLLLKRAKKSGPPVDSDSGAGKWSHSELPDRAKMERLSQLPEWAGFVQRDPGLWEVICRFYPDIAAKVVATTGISGQRDRGRNRTRRY